MIPTYHCAPFLAQTLNSVLAQDPGAAQMQIEVVDDASTNDDPQAVVAAVGRGRVAFHAKPRNSGAIATFNTCIERAQGELVHILHGDDFVLPGFYQQVEAVMQRHPDIALVATQVQMVNEQAEPLHLSPTFPSLGQPSHDARPFYYENPFRTPGIVVRRSFYEQQGGFLEPLIHVADWEMWVRAIQHGGGMAINQPLAAYRCFSASHSNRITREAGNLRDWERLQSHWTAQQFPGFETSRFDQALAEAASQQCFDFLRRGDRKAASASMHCFLRHARPGKVLLEATRYLYRWTGGQFRSAK